MARYKQFKGQFMPIVCLFCLSSTRCIHDESVANSDRGKFAELNLTSTASCFPSKASSGSNLLADHGYVSSARAGASAFGRQVGAA
jgi:hypothetical protein